MTSAAIQTSIYCVYYDDQAGRESKISQNSIDVILLVNVYLSIASLHGVVFDRLLHDTWCTESPESPFL